MAGRLSPRGEACARKVLGMRVNRWGSDGSLVMPPYVIEEVIAQVTEVTEQGIDPQIAASNEELSTCSRQADEATRALKTASPDDREHLMRVIDRDRQTAAEARVRLKIYEIAKRDIRMGGCNRQTVSGETCGNANLSFVDHCPWHEDAPVATKTGKKKKPGGKSPAKKRRAR